MPTDQPEKLKKLTVTEEGSYRWKETNTMKTKHI